MYLGLLATSEYQDRRYCDKLYASSDERLIPDDSWVDGDNAEKEFDDKILSAVEARSVLDIGRGNGEFILKIAETFE